VAAMFAGFVLKDALIRPAAPLDRARQHASASR